MHKQKIQKGSSSPLNFFSIKLEIFSNIFPLYYLNNDFFYNLLTDHESMEKKIVLICMNKHVCLLTLECLFVENYVIISKFFIV